MVDPNPGRGMPAQLQRYWLGGKGAAKIRWGMPGDFNRCVRNLRKHFPKNPKGLCNILHQKALGAPPGKGHGHSMDEATALLAAMPMLGSSLWVMAVAPIGRPTGEPRRVRIFEHGSLEHRPLPLPLSYRKVAGEGHAGSVMVGRALGMGYGPDEKGQDYAWAWGDWFDEEVIPEVKEAKYIVARNVAGPSVDPGGKVVATINPETGFEHMMKYTIGGITVVSIPAFSGMNLTMRTFEGDEDFPDDDPDLVMAFDDDSDCGCDGGYTAGLGPSETFAVNSSGWRGLPLAPRDAVFDNDDAVLRIAAWANVSPAGADVNKLRRAFLWYDPQQPATATTSYRLPVGDVINGKLTLVYHAIYAAAALLSGAHGGLPNVPESDKQEIRNAISAIYPEMAREFNDSSIRAPWDRSMQPGVQMSLEEYNMYESDYPLEPPAAWFANPGLTAKTPLTVTEDGHVYGHLAAWGECHRDVNMRECVLAPRSKKNYEPFHLGTVFTAEGETLRVGKIVMDTRHASINLGYTAAALHYDNTGDEVAVVRAGEDEYGIWVAGAVVPDANRKKVAKLRRSPLSGDWRAVEGNLELTAALAVNFPAFPVYAMENDERLALVAAGSVYPEVDVEEDGTDLYDAELAAAEEEDDVQEERAIALQDIFEDDEIYAQRERAARLAGVFAAEAAPVAPAAAPVAPGAPAPAAQPPAPGEEPIDEAGMLARQLNTVFSIVEEPAGGAAGDGDEPVPPAGAPVAPAPAPAAAAPPAPAPVR